MTLGALGVKGFTGQLTLVADDGLEYSIVFLHGSIVGASSPLAQDSTVRIAVLGSLVTEDQAGMIARRIACAENRDEVDVLGESVHLSTDQMHWLRRSATAQRAARTFAVERGEFVVTSSINLSVNTDEWIDVRAVIYYGARTILSPQRLAAELAEYGTHFGLRDGAEVSPTDYSFTDLERPIVAALERGASLAELVACHRERRTVLAALYAMLACRACRPVVPPPGISARLARGTPSGPYTLEGVTPPPPRIVAAGSTPAAPSEPVDPAVASMTAFRRGLSALECDALDDAISEIETAVELSPRNVDYRAALAWARFRAAPDKLAVADETRKVLAHAILKSQTPETAHLYLGRVERLLGRDRRALHHLQEVLAAQPHNAEVATEVRFLEQRLRLRSC